MALLTSSFVVKIWVGIKKKRKIVHLLFFFLLFFEASIKSGEWS